jgi:hypothetical protein
MVVLLEGSPISTDKLWSFVRETIGFLITSLTKALQTALLCCLGSAGTFIYLKNKYCPPSWLSALELLYMLTW